MVDMPQELSYALSCSFKDIKTPSQHENPDGGKAKSASVCELGDDFLLLMREYQHQVTGCFLPKGLPNYEQPLLMYFGFDLDFAPICLVTTRTPELSVSYDGSIQESKNKDRPSASVEVPLGWLLSELARGETSTTMLAFRGCFNAPTECTARSYLSRSRSISGYPKTCTDTSGMSQSVSS